MYRIFGLPVGSPPLEQQEMAQMLHPDDRGAVARALRSAVIDQAIVGTEMRIFRSDGVLRWLDARVKPVIDESTGRTTALFGTIWDITERKLAEDQIRSLNLDLEERVKRRTQQLEETNSRLVAQVEERTRAEEALQISQNNLRTLIESTHDAIWSIDREYRFTTVNAAFYSVLRLYNGYEVKINDSALFDTIGIPSQKWLQYYNRVLQGERFMAQSQYQLAGYIFDIEISFNPIINEESSVVGAVVFARDITDRLRVEREIRDSEALLNLILETVVTGIALTSNDGVIIRANRAFAQMLGYTPRELIGRNYTIVVPEQRRTAAIQSFEQTFQNNAKMTGLEIQLLRQNGELIDVEMSQTVVTNETNEAFVISSINNITERKEAENEIRRALEQERELRAMQSRFVVMVSHEFRTPLTTIRASAQLLERNRDKWSADKQESYFQDIDDAVNTMTVLLEDVLSWGKADARRIAFAPEATNICELLDSIVDGFRVVEEHHERVVVLAPRGESPPRLARIDAKLIRQIVSNLLANALKYSPLETSIECEMILDAGSISFRVADKGIGISEEDQKHLFEPFYRAGNVGSIAGTGLGLAIVRQAVELHGGTIHCTSAIGVGTEFIVVIPCTFS
jgi:PAS domain S-box-containing protein